MCVLRLAVIGGMFCVAAPVVAQGRAEASAVTAILPPAEPHLRVMTWNIGSNSIFADPGPGRGAALDGARPAQFQRIVRAVRPDVVCLQEIQPPRTAEDVGTMLDSILPTKSGTRWHSYGVRDVVIATPYPLSMPAARQEDFGSGPRTHVMALVSLPSESAVNNLYVVCAHMQSRGEPKDVAARQRQADVIVQGLREVRTAGAGALPVGTPFVILGDLNAYLTDPAHHVQTLLTGVISDTARYGQGMALDWDGTPLADAHPIQNGIGRDTYTFGDGHGEFPPSALDRVLYTDSRLAVLGGFVLNTTTLDSAALVQLGLREGDILRNATLRVFDHMPVVVDFRGKEKQ